MSGSLQCRRSGRWNVSFLPSSTRTCWLQGRMWWWWSTKLQIQLGDLGSSKQIENLISELQVMNKSSLEWWTTSRDRHLSEQNADWGREGGREGFHGVCIGVDEVVVITYRRASLRQLWRRAGERRLQEWRWWWPNGKLQPSMTRVPPLSSRGMPWTWIPHPLPLASLMSHSLLWIPPLLDDRSAVHLQFGVLQHWMDRKV